MTIKIFGIFISLLGLVISLLTIFSDIFRGVIFYLSLPQIGIIIIGLLLFGFGILVITGLITKWFNNQNPKFKRIIIQSYQSVYNLFYKCLHSPITTWVLLGFFIPYLFLFIWPVFLNTQIMLFPKYLPAADPIGVDFHWILRYSESWWFLKQSPYIHANLYPPLANLLFIPFLALESSLAYQVFTLVTISCFLSMTLVLPRFVSVGPKSTSLLILLMITGLFSYGFQFELERGQFNFIAMSLCFTAIFIFHKKNHLRVLAYILFILSVQLKVYPLIFLLLFVEDWRNLKAIILRFSALIFTNFALLFVLGKDIFNDFILAIKDQATDPYVWIGNHSTYAFVSQFGDFLHNLDPMFQSQNFEWLRLLLLAIIGLCILFVLIKTYLKNINSVNPTLILVCTLGAVLIPSVSHDYTLSFLVVSVIIFLTNINNELSMNNAHLKFHEIVLLVIFASAYASTLFSYAYKPDDFGILIENNFPALFVMLLTATTLYLLPHKKPINQ